MKKIIITLMALSMVLVSCSSPTSPDDYSAPTNSTTNETPKTDEKKDETKNELKVTFNSNGGSSVEAKTVSNGKIIAPSNPTKEYCEFAYWYKDDENVAFDFNSTITESIELKAKWYVHYFELENGETINNYNYKIKYGSNESNTITDINILGGTGVGMNGMFYHCDYVTHGRKIIFSYHKYPNTQDLKVNNVSVNGNVVTIKLVNNN